MGIVSNVGDTSCESEHSTSEVGGHTLYLEVRGQTLRKLWLPSSSGTWDELVNSSCSSVVFSSLQEQKCAFLRVVYESCVGSTHLAVPAVL
jgi:hypothetical protein